MPEILGLWSLKIDHCRAGKNVSERHIPGIDDEIKGREPLQGTGRSDAVFARSQHGQDIVLVERHVCIAEQDVILSKRDRLPAQYIAVRGDIRARLVLKCYIVATLHQCNSGLQYRQHVIGMDDFPVDWGRDKHFLFSHAETSVGDHAGYFAALD